MHILKEDQTWSTWWDWGEHQTKRECFQMIIRRPATTKDHSSIKRFISEWQDWWNQRRQETKNIMGEKFNYGTSRATTYMQDSTQNVKRSIPLHLSLIRTQLDKYRIMKLEPETAMCAARCVSLALSAWPFPQHDSLNCMSRSFEGIHFWQFQIRRRKGRHFPLKCLLSPSHWTLLMGWTCGR